MKKLLSLIVLGAVMVLNLMPAHAAQFRSSQDTLTVANQTPIKNLYASAQTVTIDQIVTGDLVVAGGSVIVNGVVEDGLLVVGGDVAIRATVEHNARIAGGKVVISGRVKGDLLVAGGTVTINDSATVDGDLLAAGGTVIVDGRVLGQTKLTGSTVLISGELGGLDVWSDKLTLSGKAKINGDLRYYSGQTATIDPTVSITGKTDFHQTSTKSRRTFVDVFVPFRLLTLLGYILLAWSLTRYFPRSTSRLVKNSLARPWPAIGLGLIALIIWPIISLGLMISYIGLPIGIALFGLWIFALIIGNVIGKITFGVWLIKLLTKEANHQLDWQAAVVGVLGLALVGFIPIIGWFVVAIFYLIGFGGILHHLSTIRNKDEIFPATDNI